MHKGWLGRFRGTSSATAPTLRMSAAVDDGQDHELRSLNAKVDAEWKARHERAPSIAMDYGMLEGMLGQLSECTERFREEFVPKPYALMLVPGRSCR
jgi:hypothetical protein